MTTNGEPPAVACTLPPTALDERIRAWRELGSEALHRVREPGRVVSTYRNTPETARRLARLVDAERDCCSFLHFSRHEQDGVIVVELRYPLQFAPMLDAILG